MVATTVKDEGELWQILGLQHENLKENISIAEKNEQGFLTMPFNLNMLKAMHELAPSVIVKDKERIAGYAIVFLKEGRQLYPSLEPMFVNFESLEWKERPLNSYNYYVMGQICVAKAYRGKGVFEKLYYKHRDLYRDKFDFVITEISSSNYRSLKAHERIGFEKIGSHKDKLDEWDVVLWEW